MIARKSLRQGHVPTQSQLELMDAFRQMVNDCIRIGLASDVSSLKRLGSLSYNTLRAYGVPSCYRLCAISKAAGILASRKKSIRRGFLTRDPTLTKLILVSCYRFEAKGGVLRIPVGFHRHETIELNHHTRDLLASEGAKVNSFTITATTLSLCMSKEVPDEVPAGTTGVDRNLGNISAGNAQRVVQYDLSKAIRVAASTREILRSFRRNDARVRAKLYSKYSRRRSNRIKQMAHRVTRDIVDGARANGHAIVLEDLRQIRSLYRKGNGQGRSSRARMNSWPFNEAKRQLEYKAAWAGVRVIRLSKSETKGTTMDCVRCGERLQGAARSDGEHRRQLWCHRCGRWTDRDIMAAMNISRKGLLRFGSPHGGAGEAVKGNQEHEWEPAILRVDASKPLSSKGEGGRTSLSS